ncbi:MAG: hypothetical protein FLDDKLPJ_01166 [Phycisphaerae bacterium]|nr:hypothetical protein [Phycisphaerae bacterium]
MKIELPQRTVEFVEDQVRSGAFASAEEVVTVALECLRADREFGDFAPGELDALLEEGERSGREQGWHTRDDARRELAKRLSLMRTPSQ